jgi:uncharacterized protein (DUF1778 family)
VNLDRESDVLRRIMAPELLATHPAPTITLSEADWEKFVELLENPPAPNDELKALFTEDGPKGDNKPFTVA